MSRFKKTFSIISFIALFFCAINSAHAEQNIISSVVISKAKDNSDAYELNIDSTQQVSYKARIENDESIYFDLKNSTLASNIGTIYDDVSNIDNVVVKQLDRNKVRIYVEGKNAKNTELVFVNSLFDLSKEPGKKVVINRPISDYKPTHYSSDLENQEDIQAWDDNSFNLSHLGTSILEELKNGSGGIVLIFLFLSIIIAVVAKSIAKKLSQDTEPLIGLNSNYLNNNIEPKTKQNKTKYQEKENFNDINNRQKALLLAQQELNKAHQKYQNYIENKYKGNYKPKSINIDAIKKGIAINQYQKTNKNPYLDQEVIKIKKDSIQIPPRPKLNPKTEFTSPYIQRKSTSTLNNTKKTELKPNMKFLESVTKIYEQSGRGDLANGLKNSITKAKQSI